MIYETCYSLLDLYLVYIFPQMRCKAKRDTFPIKEVKWIEGLNKGKLTRNIPQTNWHNELKKEKKLL